VEGRKKRPGSKGSERPTENKEPTGKVPMALSETKKRASRERQKKSGPQGFWAVEKKELNQELGQKRGHIHRDSEGEGNKKKSVIFWAVGIWEVCCGKTAAKK